MWQGWRNLFKVILPQLTLKQCDIYPSTIYNWPSGSILFLDIQLTADYEVLQYLVLKKFEKPLCNSNHCFSRINCSWWPSTDLRLSDFTQLPVSSLDLTLESFLVFGCFLSAFSLHNMCSACGLKTFLFHSPQKSINWVSCPLSTLKTQVIVVLLPQWKFSSVQSLSLCDPWIAAARPPCPSSTPGVHSDSRPSSRWCHPAISSSVVPFSSCPQSLPASESFPMSHLFAWGGQSTGVSALASVLPKKSQGWSPSEWTGWISLQSKGPSSLFQHHSSKASILRRSAFFTVQLSHPYMTTGKTIAFTRRTLCYLGWS